MKGFEMIDEINLTLRRAMRPGSRMRKLGHNAVALFLVATLSIWQTPAAAFADPLDDGVVGVATNEETVSAEGTDADAAADVADEGADAADAPADTAAVEADAAEGADAVPGDFAESEQAEPQKWELSFDANGGKLVEGADDAAIELVEDSGSVRLPEGLYEREGYEFAGWSTVADPADENIEAQEKLFAPDGVQLYNLAYRYVVLTEDNATEDELKDAIEASDGTKVAVLPMDEEEIALALEQGDDYAALDTSNRQIRVCNLAPLANDEGKLKLYAQWREAKDAGKAADKADAKADAGDAKDAKDADVKDAAADSSDEANYIANDGVEAVDVQGKAAKKQAAARQALAALDAVDSAAAAEMAEDLFAQADSDEPAAEGDADAEGDGDDADGAEGDDPEGDDPENPDNPDDPGDDPEPAEPPRQGDGSNIENITAKWITPDSVDNGDDALLYRKPSKDEAQSVRLQINYALSGEHNYEPGDITITIPAYIFQDRNGNDYGDITIPFPKDPSTRGDFNWKKVGDTYVLTSTKMMSAATKGYIQFAFSNLTPHMLVDMQKSAPFDAYIQVTTHKGNTIALRSNALTAQFDTEAKVTDVRKRVSGAATRTPAANVKIPDQLKDRYADETEFIVVTWRVWGETLANTMYTLDSVDTIPSTEIVGVTDAGEITEAEAQGFVIGSTADDGMSLTKEAIYHGYKDGETNTYTYQTAYPASQFLPDTLYTFHNEIKFIVTEDDPEKSSNAGDAMNPNVQDPDPQLVTEVEASAKTTFEWHNPKWEDPTGHFMVFKNGNDDHEQNGSATNNISHKNTYTTSDLHMWSKNYQGWYGIYHSGINDLQDEYEESGTDGSIRLSYTIDSVGYVMPWMFDSNSFNEYGAVASRMSKNYNKPVSMVTEDQGISIGRYGEKLKLHEDYDFAEIEFPEVPWLYYGKPQNINADGSWAAVTAGDGTFKYTRDSDKANWPDIDLELQLDGEWVHWATASWKSGSKVITLADGTTQTDGVVTVPAETENFRTLVTLQNKSEDEDANVCLQAAIDYDVRVVVDLKSTEAMMALIDQGFSNSNTPELSIWNGVNMKAYDASDSQIVSIDKDAYDLIRGYTTETQVYPSKSSRQTIADVDYEERVITIHYSAKVEERSFIHDKVTYEQAIADGRLVTEKSGIWYDLLPKGVTPDTKTVKLRSGDKVEDVYTIEDYKGSGRTLLVVKATLTPTPTTYRSGSITYYEDVPSISFDAKYGFDEFLGYGDNIHNVISFESDNERIGTVEHYSGEADDPTNTNAQECGNVSTPRAFDTDAAKGAEERTVMTDLDADRDDPSFVYAGTYTKIDIISAGRVSLSKDVQVNNDGIWSTGVYYGNYADAKEAKAEKEYQDGGNKRTVFEGGMYAYRLRMISATGTISSDLIMYDSLENFYALAETDTGLDPHDPIDVDAQRWQGYFRSIDVSQLVSMGCAPVVYYSTVERLELSDETHPDQGNATNMDLTNTDIWVKAGDYAGSLDDVKAVAIDARKKADGSDFELHELESATVIVRMQAPTGEDARGYIAKDAHAYNNAYLTGKTRDEGAPASEGDADNFVRKDYTKIGLMEYNYSITKTWDDDNNRDGKRPATKTVKALTGYDEQTGAAVYEDVEVYDLAFRLYRDGSKISDEVAEAEGISNVAYVRVDTNEAVFTNLPYTDPAGNKYRYSAVEDKLDGYTSSVSYEQTSAAFTNKHTPGRVNVSGEKQWVGDPDDGSTRPASITVKLFAQYWDAAANDGEGDYAEAKQIKAQTVRPDKDGDWKYSFDNLYEYQDGHEVIYTVEETITDAKGKSYIQGIDADGRTFVNTYHPYGDLSVTKTTTGTTEASRDQAFTFEFNFSTTEDVYDEETGQTTKEPVPLPGIDEEYLYDVLAEDGTVVSSGTLTQDNLAVTIQGGQTIHVKGLADPDDGEVLGIPEGVKYQVTEQEVSGFTQTSASKMSGSIQPNTTIEAGLTNAYSARGSINLAAVKTLLNKDIKNNQFRYQLYSVDEDGAETLIGTASNSAKSGTTERLDGTVESSTAPVTFGAINYTQADHGKTFKYKIVEVDSGKDGYTYDDTVCVVTVSVEDNGDGTLSVVPTYYEKQEHSFLFISWDELVEVDGAAFENTYEAAGETTLRAWKDLQGRRATEGEFTFELYDQDGNLLQTKTNDGTGTVTFDAIAYDQTDIGNIYHYAIREVPGNDPTVKYSEAWYGYQVEVIDNEDGTLYAETTAATPTVASDSSADGEGGDGQGAGAYTFTDWTTEGAETPIFVNTLNPGNLNIAKNLKNASPEVADAEFTFRVKLIGDELPNWEPAGAKTDATGAQTELVFGDEDGQIAYAVSSNGESFQAEFEIALKGGESIQLADLPANTAYQVFEDTPDGWLLESEGLSGTIVPLQTSEAKFTNEYKPDVTSVQFAGTKTLDGTAAAENAFSFELVDEAGEVLQTVKTLPGGFIQFAAIEYQKEDVGEHVYTIREVDPADDTLDWDRHEETVTVTVALDPTSGNPVATVAYDADGIAFANKTRPGNLKITKAVDIATDANRDDEFTFKVTLNNSKGMPLGEDSAIYWYVEDADGKPVMQSANGQGQQELLESEVRGVTSAVGNGLVAGLIEGAQETILSQSGVMGLAPIGEMFELKASPLAVAAASGVFHATSDMLRGKAYAVLTASGEFIFFRSYSSYSNNTAGSFTDINGTTYSGRVFSDFEELTYTGSSGTIPWNGYRSSIRTVRVADGQAIKPGSLSTYFMDCSNLVSADLSRFDTSNVEKMGSAFRDCRSLETLDLSGFDTGKLNNMYYTFNGCRSLTTLNLASFTHNVTNENNTATFGGCSKLSTIIVGADYRLTSSALWPTPPDGQGWTRVEGGYSRMTPSSLVGTFGESKAGTWVWNSLASIGYVVYDANTGSTTATRQQLAVGSQQVTMPGNQTTKLHYNLTGWNTAADGSGTSYGPNETATLEIERQKTITLYAQWEDTGERYYTVRHYQQNTGLSGYSLADADANQPGVKGEEVTPETKDYTGFVAPDTQTVVVADDDSTVVSYYYKRAQYDIVFDGNGATSGQMPGKLHMVYNVSQNLTPNSYQKKGAIFMGWNTKADGSGTQYVDAQSIVNLSATDGATVTLYAQWFDNSDSELNPTAGVIYVKCKAGETIVLPDLPDGTTYTIEEVDLPNGWSLDGWSQTGQVGDDTGTIVANVTNSATATNAYSATGMFQLQAHKKLEGGDLTEGQFSFQLTPVGNAPLNGQPKLTATNGVVDDSEVVADEGGNESNNAWYQTAPVDFDPIELTQADIGKTYTYQIREVAGDDDTITYDGHAETVTVAVKDGGHGTIATEVSYDTDGALFTNEVKPAKLTISKETLNASGHTDQDFTFKVELFDKDGNPLEGEFDAKKYKQDYQPETQQTVTRYAHTPNINDSGVASGTYNNYMNVTQTVNVPNATSLHVDIRYSTESRNYDYIYLKNASGAILANDMNGKWIGATESGYQHRIGGGNSTTFDYNGRSETQPTASVSYDIAGDTVLFNFISDGSQVYWGYYAIVTATIGNPESGYDNSTVENNSTITLKGGEHIDITGLPDGATYKVTEVEVPESWTLEDAEGDEGTLAANETSEAKFKNLYNTPADEPYTAEGTAQIRVSKTVEGDIIHEDDNYEFVLLDANGAELQRKGTDTFGSKDSTVTFDNLTYTLDDVPEGGSKTFAYQVQEVKGEDESVEYATNTIDVLVTATDEGNGYISTVVQYVKYEDSEVEVGSGSPEPSSNESVKLRLEANPGGSDADLKLGDTVDYRIWVENLSDEDMTNVPVMDGSNNVIWIIDNLPAKETVEGEAHHVVTNGDILAGKVAYKVSVNGVECTAESRTEYAEIADAAAVTFENKVKRTSISGTKTWDDDDNASGKRPAYITVQLVANGSVRQSQDVYPDEDGNWSYVFDKLPVLANGAEYSVQEVPVEGYETSVAENGVDFTNTRIPNAKLEFTKILNGMDAELANPRFSFTLTEVDESGNPVAGGITDTQANSKFQGSESTVTFQLEKLGEGEHWFRVVEDAVSDANILGDDMAYLVYVVVEPQAKADADDAEGNTDAGDSDGKGDTPAAATGKLVASDPVYYLVEKDAAPSSLMGDDGSISADADDAPAFYNNSNGDVEFNDTPFSYTEDEEGRVVIYPEAQKYLNGSTAALTGGDFEFTLTGNNGDGSEVSRTEPNDVTGKVAFFDKDDVDLEAATPEALWFDAAGTYEFQIAEVIPDGATDNGDGTFTLDDTTYDGSTITMTVTVVDNGGVLSADVSYSGMKQGSDPAFYNEREVPPVDAAPELYLSVDKFRAGTHAYLVGAQLAVYDADGNLVEEWTTDGYVHKMTAALQPGKTYTLVEESAPDGFDAVADTEFTVATDGAGISISARESTTELVEADHLALYDPKTPVEKTTVRTVGGTPQTGDYAPIALTLAVALMALAAFWFARRQTATPAVRGKHAKR